MTNRTDLGESYPAGHPSGRIMKAPVSVQQARARVLSAMDLLEESCHIGLDVGYSQLILDEAEDDYREMVLTGEVDEGRTAAIKAQTEELLAECAELQAEAVILQAMLDLEDGEA